MRSWVCPSPCTQTFVVIVGLFLVVVHIHQGTDWFFTHERVNRDTFMKEQGGHDTLSGIISQQRMTGPGFLQLWRNMRTEFVTSLQSLLDDGAKSTDPRLIGLIQSYMFPPSKSVYKMSYNFGPPKQYIITKKYFKLKKRGKNDRFFVECGGLDGERSSTTHHLERDGWQGLLIEADPDYFLQSLGKNRRSWKLNAALCPSTEPSIVKFKEVGNSGRGKLTDKGTNRVPCIPLPMILKALNRTSIDFLSLDVEGLEMEILRTLPFKDVDIKAINLEYNHSKEKPAFFTKFMASVGYTLFKKIDEVKETRMLYTHDLYYIKDEKTLIENSKANA